MSDYKHIKLGDFANKNRRLKPSELRFFLGGVIFTLGFVGLIVHFANWIDTVKIFN